MSVRAGAGALCLALASTPSGAAPLASPAAAGQATACRVSGWSGDEDPKGLNVRSGPSASAPVIGVLPAPARRGGDEGWAVSFDITGAQNGWLRIKDARDDTGDTGLPERVVPKTSGWVSGGEVRLAIQSSRGRSRPDAASPVVVDLSNPKTGERHWLTDVGRIERVLACSGAWVQVEARHAPAEWMSSRALVRPAARVRPGVFRAWFRGACGNQQTTCDDVGE